MIIVIGVKKVRILLLSNQIRLLSILISIEAEDIAIKRIKFIPCFMEEPFPLDDWLDFLVGANIWIDFSKEDKYDDSLQELIKKITSIEDQLATHPRKCSLIFL